MSSKEIINYLISEAHDSSKLLMDYTNDLTTLQRKIKFMNRYMNALKDLEKEVRDSGIGQNYSAIMHALEKIDKVINF